MPATVLSDVPLRWDGWADIGALAPAPSADWRGAALIGRPEIVRALREYDLAEISLQGEVAKRWPELRLSPGYAWGANGVREDPLNDFTQESALGVSFEVPTIQSSPGTDRRSTRAARGRGSASDRGAGASCSDRSIAPSSPGRARARVG